MFFCCVLALCSLGLSAQECRSLRQLSKQFLKAAETRDSSLYLRLMNETLYLQTIRADTALKENLHYIVDDLPQRKRRHLEQLDAFVLAVNEKCGTKKWKLKLVSAKIVDTFPGEYLVKDHNVEIVFRAQGKKLRFYTVVSFLKGCHYLFEPVMADLYEMK